MPPRVFPHFLEVEVYIGPTGFAIVLSRKNNFGPRPDLGPNGPGSLLLGPVLVHMGKSAQPWCIRPEVRQFLKFKRSQQPVS